ncbi:glutathione synthase [Pseudovibrio sp. Tun.PSC04-5.I4]|uniref:glutathione synthase n=1 Tax=Pseudovibrio sp. Tun.PSC04-5.I4 TaxID=1798213 RepID=UPI00088382D0|nr:glutathione synthase [Pseudovibrio sp. Tun.PSC04-5.I4]SDR25865.1 glutathione synthase [Pseudovibrio sp. Tun.PSC04-5.I4]
MPQAASSGVQRPIKVAVQMDHISSINIAGDSAFALMLEAQDRGYELFHYTPERLALWGEKVMCRVEPVTVRDEVGNHFSFGEPQRVDMSDMDVVLMRQDPPFDLAYIAATHILEKLAETTLVVNNPISVRNAPEKLFVTQFSDLMPATLVTHDKDEIDEFRRVHGDVVMKPLFGHGGAAVFRVAEKDLNYGSLYDFFAVTFREPWVIQKFLPNVKHGDKRILLVDGEFAGAVNRVPAEGDLRSNMVRGGSPKDSDLTDREREICARLRPALKEQGLILVGIDVIDGNLTEINVTAPTGIRAIQKLGGPDVAAMVWDVLEKKLSK